MPFFEMFVILFLSFLFALLVFAVLKKIIKAAIGFFFNALLGIAALLFLNLLGAGIGINIITVLVAAVFGLAGGAVLFLLKLRGSF